MNSTATPSTNTVTGSIRDAIPDLRKASQERSLRGLEFTVTELGGKERISMRGSIPASKEADVRNLIATVASAKSLSLKFPKAGYSGQGEARQAHFCDLL